MSLLNYWEVLLAFATLGSGIAIGRKSRGILNKKDNAVAEQELIKIKKEDVSLSQMIQETYQRLNKDVFTRLEHLEISNTDLTNKYNEILTRNGVLEEKSDAYEKKYEKLKLDYVKLKLDYDKVHTESKQLREEIDILKNNVL